MNIHVNIFRIYAVCVYIIHIHKTHTHILSKQKRLFWMRLIVWQHYFLLVSAGGSRFKVQGSLLFVTYTIIQGIIGSEMLVRTGPLNGKCKKEKKNMIIE